MIDAFVPEGALTADAEQTLYRDVTDVVLEHEFGDVTNERARSSSWLFAHRPRVFVGGSPAPEPRYRFVVSLPEGLFDDARRRAIVEGITAAVARAEGSPVDGVRGRVWVLAVDVPDGAWGSRGQIVRLPDILGYLLGDAGRELAQRRLPR